MKLCECGCGKPAPIAKKNLNSLGIKKGEPQRFVKGHHNRNGENVACAFCGNDAGHRSLSRLKRHKLSFCSVDCGSLWQKKYASGRNHSCWIRGYGRINNYGYRMIRGDDGKPRAEQRVVVENILGRRLQKDEIVHHVNGNKLDNRNNNLLVCSRSYHKCLHETMAIKYQQKHFG